MADAHDNALADPEPKAGHDAAESKSASGKTDKFKGDDSHIVHESLLSSMVGSGCNGEGGEGVECLANNVGHERSDAPSGEGDEDGGEEESESISAGAVGE